MPRGEHRPSETPQHKTRTQKGCRPGVAAEERGREGVCVSPGTQPVRDRAQKSGTGGGDREAEHSPHRENNPPLGKTRLKVLIFQDASQEAATCEIHTWNSLHVDRCQWLPGGELCPAQSPRLGSALDMWTNSSAVSAQVSIPRVCAISHSGTRKGP